MRATPKGILIVEDDEAETLLEVAPAVRQIGRETQSLMMMVTPRIINYDDDEERLGIAAP